MFKGPPKPHLSPPSTKPIAKGIPVGSAKFNEAEQKAKANALRSPKKLPMPEESE